MATRTVPQVPNYWAPNGQKLQNQSDFWADNPYNDPYSDFEKQTGGYAKSALDSANAADPLAGGGGWNAALSRMGSGYPDMNDPATKSALKSYMDNVAGDRNRMLAGAATNLANASVASTRGGYGVAGGTSPEAAAYKTAMDTASSQYGTDFKTAMDYLYKNANLDMQTKQALMQLIAAKYGFGKDMTGMQLQGLQSGQKGLEDWLKEAYGAYSGDVNRYNKNVMGEPDLRVHLRDLAHTQSRQSAADYQQSQIAGLQSALASGMGGDMPGGFDPTLNSPMAVVYRTLLAKGAVPALQGYGKGGAGGSAAKAKAGATTDPMQAMLTQLQAAANPATGLTAGIGSRGGTSRLPTGGTRAPAPATTDTSGTGEQTTTAPGDYEGYGGSGTGPQATGAAGGNVADQSQWYGPFGSIAPYPGSDPRLSQVPGMDVVAAYLRNAISQPSIPFPANEGGSLPSFTPEEWRQLTQGLPPTDWNYYNFPAFYSGE